MSTFALIDSSGVVAGVSYDGPLMIPDGYTSVETDERPVAGMLYADGKFTSKPAATDKPGKGARKAASTP